VGRAQAGFLIMCGLAGLLVSSRPSPAALEDWTRRMIQPIAHRGPDDSGTWSDPGAGVALGFRRLAIMDLSPNGHQPMASASGRFVMVFNGEVYNFGELRRELEPQGYRFRGHSDSEVILAAFERWGIRAALGRFVGMFAIAVWDAERRELSLVRDRLGKKPLYVYREKGLITFGSELKTLVAGPSFDRSIDQAALASYLRYLYVAAPRTIYRHAIKVPAAHVLTLSDADLPLPASQPYWSLRDAVRNGRERPFRGTDAEAVDELEALLTDATRCRMQADVPLGALLSGGIDSSTVVALMQKASARPVKTYTIGFAEQDFDESRHATRVAEHLGTDHTQVMLTGADARALIPRLPDIFDEPLANPSQLPTLLVSQLARRDVTVALCGDGGDEMFGGYNRYVYGTRMLPPMSRLPRFMRQPIGAGLGYVPAVAWDRLARLTGTVAPGFAAQRVGERVHKLGRLLSGGSVGEMYRSLLSAWPRPQDLVLGGGGVEDVGEGILDEDPSADLLDRMMLADQTTYLPDDLLAKLDRASMAVSLEVRAPLLDQRVAEFSWRLPRTLKLRDGVGKWILRQVLYRHLPRELVERPKMGFSVPIDDWLRGPLRSWGADILSPDGLRQRGLLDPAPVARAWDALQEGQQAAGPALWAVLMFESWRARWAA
jgi:asparagine synthase (glutamine-hydrolysing)